MRLDGPGSLLVFDIRSISKHLLWYFRDFVSCISTPHILSESCPPKKGKQVE